MKNKFFVTSLIVILSMLLASCQNPGTTTAVQEETLQALIAGTLTAVANEELQTQAAQPTNTATLAPTSTPEPTFTPTKEVIKLTFTQNVNCRRGATKDFNVVTTFKQGMEAIVLGQNPEKDYYFVQVPDDPTEGCWIMGELASISGDTGILPIFTPRPTPFPTFTLTPLPVPYYTVVYSGLTACGAGWAANFTITNTGSLTVQSIKIANTVEGIATPFIHTSNSFIQWSGGAKYLEQTDLTKGESAIVSTCSPGEFTADPTNLHITAEITICTINDLKGVCTIQKLSYIPH